MRKLAKRVATIVFALGLASCGDFAAPPKESAPSASVGAGSLTVAPSGRNYLYVDRATALHKVLIERYLLHNGIPEKAPGFTITSPRPFDYGGQIAVAGDGTLFVISDETNAIDAFAFGKHTPERSIDLPSHGPCVRNPSAEYDISTIAADRQGYLFVQFVTYYTAGKPAGPPQDKVCAGIWVFAPGVKGHATPVLTIPLPLATYSHSLSVDPADNLYIALGTYEVREYADATTQPVLTREFRSSSHLRPLATTDESENVFIVTTKGLYGSEHINRFTATGNPHDGPVNSIDVNTPNPHFPTSMTAFARHVYLVNDEETGIEMYHAYQRGPQTPFAFVNAKNVTSIQVAP
jgi:hypothetical protein